MPMESPVKNRARLAPLAAALALALLAAPALSQDYSKVEIKTTRVAEGVYALEGAGGNIGLVVGSDRAFVIDDQYAPMAPKILAAIRAVTDKPVSFVLNTHWHGDHTGGNEAMAAQGALLVAHDNARKRLSAGQFMEFFNNQVPPAASAALPVVTFNDQVSFHLGGHTVSAIHVADAHTDGDAVVRLAEADVIHCGDIVFYGLYPFIDYGSGGSLAGMAAGVERILALSGDATRFIPGHGGPVLDRAQIGEYLAMLKTVHGRIDGMIREGKTLEAVVAAKPTAEFDAKWGKGFLPADKWVELNYRGMSKP